MNPIPLETLTGVIRDLDAMSLADKEEAVDRLYSEQPDVLAHIFVLSRRGVSMPVLDHVIHLGLLIHDAFSRDTTGQFPRVTEAMLFASREKYAEMVDFVDTAQDGQRQHSMALTMHTHTEIG